MDLVLDATGVHYSTPLEQFETSLLNLFDKGILATHSVPHLEKVGHGVGDGVPPRKLQLSPRGWAWVLQSGGARHPNPCSLLGSH